MNDISKCEYPIKLFAIACERINDLSRTLRANPVFSAVTTGSDVRNYESGWRLEKWIEAEIVSSKGLRACWWLELGSELGKWKIESNLNIPHTELHINLPTRFASTENELRDCLAIVVDELVNALKDNADFSSAIKNVRKPA